MLSQKLFIYELNDLAMKLSLCSSQLLLVSKAT